MERPGLQYGLAGEKEQTEVIYGTDRLREMNEDRRSRFGSPGRTLALLCECGEADCQRTVLVTTEDYDARRPGRIVHGDHAPLHAVEDGA